MKVDDYNALKGMLSEFRQEVKDIDTQLQTDMERIRDIDARLKVFRDAEPEDFKVFSPRNMEAVHREEIERIREEKSVYEKNDRELIEKKEFLLKYIIKLEGILKCRKKDSFLEEEEAEELHDACIRDLEQLVHKIEQSSAHIVTNPIQARQDFAVIGRSLKETVDKMRDTVWIV